MHTLIRYLATSLLTITCCYSLHTHPMHQTPEQPLHSSHATVRHNNHAHQRSRTIDSHDHLSRDNTTESTATPLAFEPSPLIHALCTGKLKEAQRLIDTNTDVNGTNKNLETPLLLLLQQIKPLEPLDAPENTKKCTAAPAIRLLLDNKASVHASNYYGNTPLLIAVDRACPAVIELLLDRGAVVNTCNAQGITPLYSAVISGRWKTVRLLLIHGATPLTLADPHFTSLSPEQRKQLREIQQKVSAERRVCNRLCEPIPPTKHKKRSCIIL